MWMKIIINDKVYVCTYKRIWLKDWASPNKSKEKNIAAKQ